MGKFNIKEFIEKEDVNLDIERLSEEFLDWMRDNLNKEDHLDLHVKMLKDCTAGDRDAQNYVMYKIMYFLIGKGLDKEDLEGVADAIYSKNYGLGVLDGLDRDEEVGEIFVNGTGPVWIEKDGRRLKTNIRFKSNDELIKVIRRAIEFSNQSITEIEPRVHANRYDNSRLYAVIPPIASRPYLRIRKFKNFRVDEENYLEIGTISGDMLKALSILVKCRANILIIGPMSSGKTTLLKLLAGYIPEDQVITVLETTPELHLDEMYPEKNIMSIWENKDIGIEMEDLFIDVLRSSADRIICGEARGKEANQLVEGMTRGMEGSIATIHSSGAYESVDDLARMCALANRNIDIGVIKRTIANAVDIVVHMHRCVDGTRKVIDISEIIYDGGRGRYDANKIFEWDGGFKRVGGISEKLIEKLSYYGIKSEEVKFLR